jgi:DNA polymerase IV
MQRRIAHVDMDAFFAAIEQRDDPALRGKPVIVGGDPASRGVVAAASYEVRKYGVRSAMSSSEARRRCPHAIFVRPDGRKYRQVSRHVMAILGTYTPLVEQVSVDEAFLDLTGSERLFGPAEEIARTIRQRIREELSLTASVGIAPNKFLAKLASEHGKPDGLVVIPDGGVEDFLRDLPIVALWGVGEATAQRLIRLGIETVGQLAATPKEQLQRTFGEVGGALSELAQGHDDRPVQTGGERKSCSAETTFARDISDVTELRRTLLALSEDTGRRLRAEGLQARTVTLKLRYSDFRTLTRRVTLEQPTNADKTIYETVRGLLTEALLRGKQVRLLGVAASGFTSSSQLRLFDEAAPGRHPVDEALDTIRRRFGSDIIFRGTLAKEPEE